MHSGHSDLVEKVPPTAKDICPATVTLTEATLATKHGDQNIVSKCLMLICIVPLKAPLYPKPFEHTQFTVILEISMQHSAIPK